MRNHYHRLTKRETDEYNRELRKVSPAAVIPYGTWNGLACDMSMTTSGERKNGHSGIVINRKRKRSLGIKANYN
jgi:hypothetical protein